jgi:hypothetical protein
MDHAKPQRAQRSLFFEEAVFWGILWKRFLAIFAPWREKY